MTKDEMMNLVKIYPDMDLYLDAGDNCSSLAQIRPYRSVKGNCDYYPYDEKAFIHTGEGNIFMRHLPYINKDEESNIKLFIHGHTHKMKILDNGKYIVLCPGSIFFSRDDSNGTYAIIEMQSGSISIDIIDIFTKSVLLHF